MFGKSAFLLILSMTVGCATPPPTTDPGYPPASADSPGMPDTDGSAVSPNVSPNVSTDPTTIVFFDSRVFDRDLSSAMRSDSPEIVVDVPVGFSLNEIPPRVDRWLYSVKDSGGAVKAEPEIRQRGIFTAAIDVVFSFFERVGDKLTFAPADRYRATLVYASDGTVNRIVFNRR